jgi:hypothetical protein
LSQKQESLYNAQSDAGVAQSVEQHIRNVRVVGSIPITGSINSKACSDAGLFRFYRGYAGATLQQKEDPTATSFTK